MTLTLINYAQVWIWESTFPKRNQKIFRNFSSTTMSIDIKSLKLSINGKRKNLRKKRTSTGWRKKSINAKCWWEKLLLKLKKASDHSNIVRQIMTLRITRRFIRMITSAKNKETFKNKRSVKEKKMEFGVLIIALSIHSW